VWVEFEPRLNLHIRTKLVPGICEGGLGYSLSRGVYTRTSEVFVERGKRRVFKKCSPFLKKCSPVRKKVLPGTRGDAGPPGPPGPPAFSGPPLSPGDSAKVAGCSMGCDGAPGTGGGEFPTRSGIENVFPESLYTASVILCFLWNPVTKWSTPKFFMSAAVAQLPSEFLYCVDWTRVSETSPHCTRYTHSPELGARYPSHTATTEEGSRDDRVRLRPMA
jgi:hypothetical protein